MDNPGDEERIHKENPRIATRERVQQFRARRNPPLSLSTQSPPMTGQERMRNYRLQKRQQALPISHDTVSSHPAIIPSILSTTALHPTTELLNPRMASAIQYTIGSLIPTQLPIPSPAVLSLSADLAPPMAVPPRSQNYGSAKRTRRYRAQQRLRAGYIKPRALSEREHSQRSYAKRKQIEVQQRAPHLAIRSMRNPPTSLNSEPLDPNVQAAEELLRKKAYSKWPRLEGGTKDFKEEILESAIQRLQRHLKKLGKHKSTGSIGLQLDWNTQLYAFLKLQLKAEKEWRNAEMRRQPTGMITRRKTRKELALLVANAGGWSTRVMRRILQQDVVLIQYGKFPIPKQGSHVKLVSWLTDAGTILAMREYMSMAGEGKLVISNLHLTGLVY